METLQSNWQHSKISLHFSWMTAFISLYHHNSAPISSGIQWNFMIVIVYSVWRTGNFLVYVYIYIYIYMYLLSVWSSYKCVKPITVSHDWDMIGIWLYYIWFQEAVKYQYWYRVLSCQLFNQIFQYIDIWIDNSRKHL